ncbi:ATP-dependent helicase [Clostridium sp. SYSU_GA19001]|uniref:ATP-dependent helicase n=1 Tax=Clostridium caldaquaticum TaxID=2940653 RepID=UPI0020776364|nr:ATP-dependent helicase [Clostridium caldaquaticum]MCM8711327.1 ATP-dependent helicase [Clostridium caldaquaticum]
MLELEYKKQYCFLRDSIIKKDFEHLDNDQIKAVINNDRNVLVLACPGSGKTTVLINKVIYLIKYGNIYGTDLVPESFKPSDLEFMRRYLNGVCKNLLEKNRVENLLKEKRVNPKNIIVITFTKAAAQNMKKRFEELCNNSSSPFFGTFHGLFYKILINYYKKVSILESLEGYKVIADTLKKYLDEVSEEKILEVKNFISIFKSGEKSIKSFNPSIDKNIFINCYNVYENYKKERGLLDFDDLQVKCKELLINKMKLLEFYRKSFKYILVDEFQDCDYIQLEVLKLLNLYNSIFAVGDEDQCIYSFRGSRPDYMLEFHKNFTDGVKLNLSTNYRSTKNIVRISSDLIKNNSSRNEKTMTAYKNEEKISEILNYTDENSQAEDIALRIEKLKFLGGYNYKDCAVLYRTNLESRSLIDAFIRKKIPFKLLDKKYNYFDHFICKDLIAYLKLSIMGDDINSFKRIINKPFRYISKISIEKLKNSCIKYDCFEMLKNMDEVSIFQIKNIERLQKQIYSLNKMSLQSAVQFIITDLGYYDYIKEYSKKFKIDLSELEDILEEFKEATGGYNTIMSFLAHIDVVNEQIEKESKGYNDEDSVTLSTVHGVKGMEFKNVFIVDCVEDILPHRSSIDSHLEEERRLFFVAITRTIDNLYICIPRHIRGKYKQPSRFVEECNINPYEYLQKNYKSGDRVVHSTFGNGRILDINKNIIQIIFKDGINRRFDINILHNNGIIRKL